MLQLERLYLLYNKFLLYYLSCLNFNYNYDQYYIGIGFFKIIDIDNKKKINI